MAKKISQDTFDIVVKENVSDFEMSVADAVQDAIEQFKAQGVDLASVMQDPSSYLPDGSKDLTNSLPHKVAGLVKVLKDVVSNIKPELENLNLSEEDSVSFSSTCQSISAVCESGLAERIIVSGAKTFDVLVEGLCKIGDYDWGKLLNPSEENDKKLMVGGCEIATNKSPGDHTNREAITQSMQPVCPQTSTHVWKILNLFLTTISHTIHQQPDLLTQTSFAALKKFNDLFINDLLLSIKMFCGGGSDHNGGGGSFNGGSGGVDSSDEKHAVTTTTAEAPQTTTTTAEAPQTTTTTAEAPQTTTTTAEAPQTTTTFTTLPKSCSAFNANTIINLHTLVDIFFKCCFMHEANKQLLFNSQLTLHYFSLLDAYARLQRESSSPNIPHPHHHPRSTNPPQFKALTCKMCMFVRGLVSDDDVRVTFGNAHENCLVLVNKQSAMTVLLDMFKVFNKKEENEINTTTKGMDINNINTGDKLENNKITSDTTKNSKNTDNITTSDNTTTINTTKTTPMTTITPTTTTTTSTTTTTKPTTTTTKPTTTTKSSTDRVLTELLSTISCLAVREEICVKVGEEGGLRDVMDLLARCGREARAGLGTGKSRSSIIKAALQFIKTLAGSDKIKLEAVEKEGASLILPSLLHSYLHDPAICEASVLCVGAICLRYAHLGARFVDDGQINVVVCKVMEIHKKKPAVLKASSIMIRNIVSRNEDKIEAFLHEGIERQLNKAMHEYEAVCGEEARYALRDLLCEVTLREMWSGKGNQIDR